MSDLDTRPAIHDLVVAFYREIVFDDLLGPFFEEVAEIDWAEHIPRLINYWCRILLGERSYTGPLIEAHRQLHRREPLRDEHFERWHRLWVISIDERWSGPCAERAKAHATATLGLISRRLRGTGHRCPHDATDAGGRAGQSSSRVADLISRPR